MYAHAQTLSHLTFTPLTQSHSTVHVHGGIMCSAKEPTILQRSGRQILAGGSAGLYRHHTCPFVMPFTAANITPASLGGRG